MQISWLLCSTYIEQQGGGSVHRRGGSLAVCFVAPRQILARSTQQ